MKRFEGKESEPSRQPAASDQIQICLYSTVPHYNNPVLFLDHFYIKLDACQVKESLWKGMFQRSENNPLLEEFHLPKKWP